MSDLSVQQLKLTLPGELYFFLKSKADRFGLTMSSYVKHLILAEVKEEPFPVFRLSAKQEELGLKALKEYRAGKTKSVNDIEAYFDNL